MAARRKPSDDLPPLPPSSRRAVIRRKLLRWYDSHRRDLPWRRRGGDPYAQWVAEVMLQQTRVETVVKYYDRFLRRFPDVGALASANQEEVLKQWEGLGYYRRIVHLHQAAKRLHERGALIPSSAKALRTLPGIGTYTAAAIASIAYGEPVASVDGNVARVVSRLCGLRQDVLTTQGMRRVEQVAAAMLSQRRPGDFNQAWMDLGSLICTPRTPACPRCPLRPQCAAHATGQVALLPIRGVGRSGRKRDVRTVVGVWWANGKVLVQRRPVGGLWSGLWEFPHAALNGQPDAAGALRRVMRALDLRADGRSRRVGVVRHDLTHRRMTFQVYTATVVHLAEESLSQRRRFRWVTPDGFRRLSVSTAHRKVFDAAQGG